MGYVVELKIIYEFIYISSYMLYIVVMLLIYIDGYNVYFASIFWKVCSDLFRYENTGKMGYFEASVYGIVVCDGK